MENSTENESNTKNLCVTCLKKGECENVFVLAFQETGFNDIFASCMGFQLSENSDLKYICLECIKTIISFYTFKEKALTSYNELRGKSLETEISTPEENSNSADDDDDIEFCSVEDDYNSDMVEPIETIKIERDDTTVRESDIKREIIDKLEQEDIDPSLDKPDKVDTDMILDSAEVIKENQWQCSYCPLILSKDNQEGIKHHRNWACRGVKRRQIKQPHAKGEEIMFSCQGCKFETTSEDQFRKHYLTHKGSDFVNLPSRNFGCTKCEYVSPRKGDVQRHLLKHLSADEAELFHCDVCDFSTRYILTLQRHFRRRHENEKGRLKKVHSCDQCSFRTAYRYSLTLHQLMHTNPVEREMFYCYQCDFKTVYKTNLRAHVILHRNPAEIPKYVCEICGFITIYKKRRRLHLLTHASEEEKQQQKDERYFQRQALMAEGIEFHCEQCDYKTHRKDCLRSHKKIHKSDEEVTLHYCDQCPFKTRVRQNLEKHMNRHRNPEDTKIYKCEYCEFRTAYPSALKIHMLRHVPRDDKTFVCDQCGFQTIYKYNYIAHQNIHKDPREAAQFSCEHCDYKATCQSNLRRHAVVHKRKKKRK